MGSANTQYAVLQPRVDHPSCNTPGHSTPGHGRSRNSRNSVPGPILGQQAGHQSIWSGNQALNNQVAPGNRANNYWDNFRR